MRNGICPKCNSTEIYRSFSETKLEAGLRASEGMPMVNFHKTGKGLFGDDFALYTLEGYLCRNCGYVESYIPLQALEKMSQKLVSATNWQKVNPT